MLLLAIIAASSFVLTAYGESGDLSYRLVPDKIIENSEGLLMIYATENGNILPTKIENLAVTSSDSSIIQILSVDNSENSLGTAVKIRAVKAGTANIAVAAPGFVAKDFPLTIYGNKYAEQLFIKTTPHSFSYGGPNNGYFSVEISNVNGFPVKATQDTAVDIFVSNTDIITLKDMELIIKKGEYYAVGQFTVEKPGDALVYASASGMQTVSSQISVKLSEPLTVQLYVYPETISSFSASYAYAIVQLQDSSGKPIKAIENIPISIKITDPNQNDINTSDVSGYFGIESNEALEIKKGSYYGYAKIVTRAGLDGTYDITASTKNYLVSDSKQLKVVDLELLDDKYASLDTVPILATGKEELVGVMHLEDSDGNPVAANNEILVNIDSTDENALSFKDVKISQGSNSNLAFGKVAYTKPDTLTLRLTDSNNMVNPVMYGPVINSLQLMTEPLVSKVHPNTEFPIILYMNDNDGTYTYFPEDTETSISTNEFIQVEPQKIRMGDLSILLNAKSVKEGDTQLSLSIKGLTSSSSINNILEKPVTLQLIYPQTIFTNLQNTFSLQILDAQQNPVLAEHDMSVKIISSDPPIIEVPDTITIKKGEYYALFEPNAKSNGVAELSILSSDLPLSKYTVETKSMIPNITISSTDYINPNTVFDIVMTAGYLNSPLSGMNVEWSVQGAQIQNKESITNEEGKAKISLLSTNSGRINVQTIVSGQGYDSNSMTKEITINLPLDGKQPETKDSSFDIMGVNPIFIIIPVSVVVIGIIFKKTSILDNISEKIMVLEKISELKEKLSQSRENR